MTDLHKASVVGRTHQGATVHTTGYSGNQQGHRYRLDQMSRVERAGAMLFSNYLERLNAEAEHLGGGKTAFTCAEPNGILNALMAGATLASIRITHIVCGGVHRNPCSAFCSRYLVPAENDSYRIRLNVVDPPPARRQRRQPRTYRDPDPLPRAYDPDPTNMNEWRVVNRRRR
jgi:hypothetical protein